MLADKIRSCTVSPKAPTYIGSASNTTAASPVVINVPTGTANGDLMIAFIKGRDTVTAAGWTQVQGQAYGAAFTLLYRIASSEPANYSFSGGTLTGVIVTFRNAVLATSTMSFIQSSNVVTLDSFTLPWGNSSFLAFYTSGNASITPTTPSGYTSVVTSGANSWALFKKENISGALGAVASTLDAKGEGFGVLVAHSEFTPPTGPKVVNTSATQTATSSTSITINVPPGTADGDLMVAVLSNGSTMSGRSLSSYSGWTLAAEAASTGSAPSLEVLYRTASSEPASYTFTFNLGSTASAGISGGITTLRGGAWSGSGTPAAAKAVNTVPISANYSMAFVANVDASASTVITNSYFKLPAFSDSDATAPSLALFYRVVPATSSGGYIEVPPSTEANVEFVVSPT